MKAFTVFLLSCLAAFIFACISDSIYLTIFGPSRDSSIYFRLDMFQLGGSLVTFIACFLLCRRTLPDPKEKPASAKTVALLFFPGVALAVILSAILAHAGARVAGVTEGGWDWQFIPAFLGGTAWGFLAFIVGFPLLCRRFENRYSAFPIALGMVCVSAFLLSLVIHWFCLKCA